ncbi:nuclease-related domain-containing protein [Shewanella sp. A14]
MTSLFTNLFAVAILLSGILLIAVLMKVMLKYREYTVKLPVDRDQLQRIPAFGLQQQIQDLQFDLISGLSMALMVVSFPFAYESIQTHIAASTFPITFIPIVIIGLTYCGYKTWKIITKLTKLRLGHTAEIATANELIGLQALGYQVFHDIQADGFNIDHLAIGKNGVFAIETKGRHKRKRDSKSTSATQGKDYQLFYKDGRLHFPSWTETKPIEQATRQAIPNKEQVSKWLTKAIGQTIPNKEFASQTKPPFALFCNNRVKSQTAGQNHTGRPNPSTHPTTSRRDSVSSRAEMFE